MEESGSPRRLAGRLVSRLRGRDGTDSPAPLPDASDEPVLPAEPTVSVVVPVYAVEEWVGDCLDSVLGQTYAHLDVVVVDDGSPDGSMAIVERYAAKDDRIRIVRQTNAGLGAARNRGIEEARGELITFVDSDDTLPDYAIARHVRSLQASGSDFSVGALERQQNSTTYVQKPWSRRLHQVLRRGVRLEEVPEVLANIFACTKVFQRAFVDRIDLRFPVGVRYEDQVPVTRAYLAATSFDILPDVVYSWRSRRDGSSITQQKARKDDLHDRLLAVEEVARLVRESESLPTLVGWYGKVFEFDLFAYVRASLDADDDYFATLRETVARILDGAPAGAWANVDLRHRITAWALVHGGRETLTRLLESPLLAGNVPVRATGAGLVADTEALGLPDGIASELLALGDKDLLVEARLDDLGWADEVLQVRGVAFTRYVDSDHAHEVSLSLQRRAGGEPVLVPTRQQRVEDANVFADRHYEDHRDDGFVAEVPAAELVAQSSGPRTVWHTRVECTALGASRDAVFGQRAEHGPVLVPQRRVVGDALLDAGWSDRLGVVVTVRRDWVVLTGWQHDDDGPWLLLRSAPGLTPRSVRVQDEQVGDVVPVHGEADAWRVRLDVPPALPSPAGRRVQVDTDDGASQPLVSLGYHGAVALPDDAGMLLATDGFVRVSSAPALLEADEATVVGDRLRLAGTVCGPAPEGLSLVGPRFRTEVPLEVTSGRWTASLPLTWTSPLDGAALPLPRDSYDLVGGDKVEVVASPSVDTTDQPAEWSLRLAEGRVLSLERSRGGETETHTRHGQELIRSGSYAAGRAAPRRPVVLVDSFVGRGFLHACGAVVRSLVERRPDLGVVWAVRDECWPAPPGTTPVMRQSAEWFEHLATASHVLTNQTMPRFFEKAPGQRLVQLWSGTPLLRFGHAVAEGGIGSAGIRGLVRDVADWDVLYTGSEHATEWMRAATGFTGEVHEVGHPAADAYRAADRAARATAVRRRLGIGEGPVLLVAPTTRQAIRAHTRRAKVVDLDVALLQEAVPGLTVLLRGHPNSANRQVLRPESGMLDVTLYPELSDLVLAADAVVTDYSSLLVDVLASDTPVGLFVPDRGEFEDLGFFLDVTLTPPGPVAETTEELVPWLAGGLDTAYDGRQRLADLLVPLDDGAAADRVVASEWG